MKLNVTRTIRRGTSLLAVLSLVSVAAVATATNASADTYVEDAVFTGTWNTTCDVPTDPDGGAANGPYSCDHTAKSLTCFAAVEDEDMAVLVTPGCHGDPVSGWTAGYATGTDYGIASVWQCENGAGSGVFNYQPTAGGTILRITVFLEKIGAYLFMEGSYIHASSGSTFWVRGTFPAACSPSAGGSGYSGTVSP